MVSSIKGRRRRLPVSRRLVCDLLHFAKQVPLFPLERSFNLNELAELRRRTPVKISWAVLFLKAYGLLAASYPALRQTFLRWPWPHIYEHPGSVAMLAVSRQDGADERLYWGKFTRPETRPLTELQVSLDRYKSGGTAEVFHKQIRFSRVPGPLRRLGWWLALNLSGAKKAKRLGTFGMSTLAGSGAINRYHPTCLTTSLTYGPIDQTGQALVTILYDHRIADGNCIARALVDLEAILNGTIAQELRDMQDGTRQCA